MGSRRDRASREVYDPVLRVSCGKSVKDIKDLQ
jgi:hypothetical protein